MFLPSRLFPLLFLSRVEFLLTPLRKVDSDKRIARTAISIGDHKVSFLFLHFVWFEIRWRKRKEMERKIGFSLFGWREIKCGKGEMEG